MCADCVADFGCNDDNGHYKHFVKKVYDLYVFELIVACFQQQDGSDPTVQVLDLGCGPGALLETLVMPASTICEPPIREEPSETRHADDEEEDFDHEDELFIARLAGIDANPEVMNPALSVLSPHSETSTFPPPRPRWEPITTELWLGGLEKYNARLEGYEAITALEVIEHLDPNVLSRFGVVTLGTYRPRIMLISTPVSKIFDPDLASLTKFPEFRL